MIQAVASRRVASEEAIAVEKPSAADLMKALKLNEIEPIHLSPNMQKDIDEKGDAFSELFEEELLRLYEES